MSPAEPTGTDQDRVRRALDRLPIFPLPNAVLLPHELLPLHIFEPRYRILFRDVIQHGRPVGIVRLAPGWEGSYEQRPDVERVCGVGVLLRHEKLADGRYNVLLRGVARVRIDSEHDSVLPYREVSAKLVEDAPCDPAAAESLADQVRRSVFTACAARPGPGANTLAQLVSTARTPAEVADVVVGAVLTDTAKRHDALVSTDVLERLALADASLVELLARGAATDGPSFRN